MADSPEKTNSAEKAYAKAASAVKAEAAKADKSVAAKVATPEPATASAKKAPAKKAPVKKAPAKKAAATPKKTPKKAVAKRKPTTTRKVAAKRKAKPNAESVTAKVSLKSTDTELKDIIMANSTKKMTDTMTKTVKDAVSEIQSRTQETYDKSVAAVADFNDFAKGNVEAIVESSKIVAGGVQDLGKTCSDEAKSAYETLTSDLKEMAAIKSPTELFQLQGKIMRRNFDAFVATSSKNSEAVMKLANDAVEPITGRMTAAAEKFTKVA